MKITRIETLALSRPHEVERQWVTAMYRSIKADCAIVVIHTDEGLTGISEASAYGWPLKVRDWVDWLSPELIGRDPLDPAIVPHPAGTNWSHDAAVAGIDIALWDLRGKIAGKRTAELLNPAAQDRVRLYASSGVGYDWRKDPHQLIEEAEDYIAQGFTAFKFRIGTDWSWDGVTVDRFLGLVRELHQTVAGRMDLMLDGNSRFTEDQGMVVAQELDRLRFHWLEEPIPREHIGTYARMCETLEMPITGGETFSTLAQFRPYLDAGAYDIVQPDAALCGITETMRIGRAADRYGRMLCPHSWHNGLMCVEHAHLVAALPRPHMLELCLAQGPLQWAILKEKPVIEDGWLLLPNKPGLGVELAEGLEERFPYIEGHYALTVQR